MRRWVGEGSQEIRFVTTRALYDMDSDLGTSPRWIPICSQVKKELKEADGIRYTQWRWPSAPMNGRDMGYEYGLQIHGLVYSSDKKLVALL